MIFAPDKRIDRQELRKGGLTKFEGAVHIPKGQKVCVGGEYKVATITNLKEKFLWENPIYYRDFSFSFLPNASKALLPCYLLTWILPVYG